MRIDHYDWSGGREAMLRCGPETGPVAVVALPLFEEANRTRTFAVTLCRALARRGIASVLPDLPGQGESLTPLESCGILDITNGLEALSNSLTRAGRRIYGVTIRSGALLNKWGDYTGRYMFAPQNGPSLVRELTRIKQAAIGPRPVLDPEYWYFSDNASKDAPDPPVEIAGNLIGVDLITGLSAYSLWRAEDGGHLRTVRLDTDPAPADRHVPGIPLWRRAEPGKDPALAALLADDIADWIAICEG